MPDRLDSDVSAVNFTTFNLAFRTKCFAGSTIDEEADPFLLNHDLFRGQLFGTQQDLAKIGDIHEQVIPCSTTFHINWGRAFLELPNILPGGFK